MEPDDLVSAEVIGEWTDLHERQVRKLAERGFIQRDGKGRYRLQATIRAITVRAREQAAGRLGSDDTDEPDLPRERALLARAQREGQLMRNAVMRAELLPERDMLEVCGAVLSHVRTNMLALASNVASRLVGVRTPAEAHEIVYEAVCRVLDAISETEVVVLGEEVKRRARQRTGSRGDLAEGHMGVSDD